MMGILHRRLAAALVIAGPLIAPLALAGGFNVRAVGGTTFQGAQTQVGVFLDNDVAGIQGWSYGLCHDPARLTVVSAQTGADTDGILGGADLFYDEIDLYPGGVTRAVIICSSCATTLPIGDDWRDLVATYDAAALDPGKPNEVVTPVRPCHQELGTPATRAVYVIGGLSNLATLVPGQVTIQKEGAKFDVRVGDHEVGEGQTVAADIFIDTNVTGVQAWSYGVCHDPARLVAIDADTGADTATVQGGAAPWFEEIDILAGGVTHAVIICSGCSETLPPGDGWKDLLVTYRAENLAPADPDTVVTPVTPCHEALGSPPTRAVYVINGRSFPAGLVSGDITIRREPRLFQFRAGAEVVTEGETMVLPVSIDSDVVGVQGWSYGLCHDPARLVAQSAVAGADTATVYGGSPPWFEEIDILAGGVTHAVIICSDCPVTLPTGLDFEDLLVTYRAADLGPADPDPVVTPVSPCHEALGDPLVRAVYTKGGLSYLAGLVPGSVTIQKRQLGFRYFGADENLLQIRPATGEEALVLDVPVFLGEDRDPGADPSRVQALSAGLEYPGDRLEVIEVLPGAALAAVNGGSGPDFFHAGILADCFHGEAVVSMGAPFDVILPAPDHTPDTEILLVKMGAVAPFYQGIAAPVTVSLPFTDACDSPPVRNVVVVGGRSRPPLTEPIEITVVPVVQVPFVRGDANIDGRVDIADPIWILNELYQSGPVASCRAAKDANADRRVDSSDAVYLINYQFLDGAPPPAPFPACGVYPEQVLEDCEAFSQCP